MEAKTTANQEGKPRSQAAKRRQQTSEESLEAEKPKAKNKKTYPKKQKKQYPKKMQLSPKVHCADTKTSSLAL